MSTKTIYRLSALAGLLSGLCIIIGKLVIPLPIRQIGEIIDFFSPLFALLFAVGLYLRQRRESGVFGGVAFIVLFMGLATVVSLDYFGAFIGPYLPDGMVDQILEGPTGAVAATSGSPFSWERYSLGYPFSKQISFPELLPFCLWWVCFLFPWGVFSRRVPL